MTKTYGNAHFRTPCVLYICSNQFNSNWNWINSLQYLNLSPFKHLKSIQRWSDKNVKCTPRKLLDRLYQLSNSQKMHPELWRISSRAGLGVVQPGDIHLHALRQHPPQHGGAHQQSKTSRAWSLGRLAGATHEGSGQHSRKEQIWRASTSMLQKANKKRSTVSAYVSLVQILVILELCYIKVPI